MDPDLTVELQHQRLEAQVGSTARGESAFMSVVLLSLPTDLKDKIGKDLEMFRVEGGLLIGMTGFTSFVTEKRDGKELLIGDTGSLIDHHFIRKGYAAETLQAMFEYGFGELGVGEMFLETYAANLPFRQWMKGLGLGGVEKDEGGVGVEFRFGRENLEQAKEEAKRGGKWHL